MADTRARMAQAIGKKHLTLREAGEWYGLSERTLRRRIAEGKLPAFRVGPRSIRVTAEDVAALAQPIPTAGVVDDRFVSEPDEHDHRPCRPPSPLGICPCA